MKGLNKEESRCFRITPSGELLIWLIIIFFIVALSSSTFMLKSKTDNDYQLFLQDVDGLIVGSPVRMMGIEVGYVTKIKPTNGEVYVKFVLTNSDVFIPQGTVATVEFTGMAGSKSLELYLPDKNSYIDNSTPLILASSPKRLHDAFDLLNQMYKKINSIIYSVSTFGSKLDGDFHDMGMNSGQIFNDFVGVSEKFVEESGKKIYGINTVIKEIKDAK